MIHYLTHFEHAFFQSVFLVVLGENPSQSAIAGRDIHHGRNARA